MKIRFVYHKGKDSFVGRAIVAWTWVLAVVRLDFKSLKHNYSHVEVWFPDEDGRFYIAWPTGDKDIDKIIPDSFFLGQCFSSTTRGEANGVRFAPASKVLHHPERWDHQEYEVRDDTVEEYIPVLGRRAKLQLGYDYWGIFGFFSPINIQSTKKWYCSELCSAIAFSLGISQGKWYKRISPRRLAKVLGGELKPLKGD